MRRVLISLICAGVIVMPWTFIVDHEKKRSFDEGWASGYKSGMFGGTMRCHYELENVRELAEGCLNDACSFCEAEE